MGSKDIDNHKTKIKNITSRISAYNAGCMEDKNLHVHNMQEEDSFLIEKTNMIQWVTPVEEDFIVFNSTVEGLIKSCLFCK